MILNILDFRSSLPECRGKLTAIPVKESSILMIIEVLFENTI